MTKSDLVIRMKDDKILLIRGIYNCFNVSTQIRISADIASAECFK